MTGTASGQATIHEVENANDMNECLSQLNANNRWALGIQSLIKDSPNWSFIKIDGVEPTLSNAANGNYWDWVELTMQWRNTAVNGVPAPTSDELAILQYLRDNVGSADHLNNLNMSFSQGFGKTGMLAVSVAYPFDDNSPAMQYGRGGRICSPPASKAQSIEFK